MTSVLNSATAAAHHAKKAEKLSHSKPSGAEASGAESEFGALFGAMMSGPGGQDLAALGGKTAPPLVGLAAEVLGPTVHIITASTPAPSDDSLYAFARSQGMDEDALALIFQKPAAVSPDDGLSTLPSPPPSPSPSPSPSPATAVPLASERLATALTPEQKAMASVLSSPPGDGRAPAETLDLGEDATLRWTLGKAAEVASVTPAPVAQSHFFGLNGVRPLMPANPPLQAATADPAAHPESAHQTLAASLILGASEAAQFARRLEMKQASQRAERQPAGLLPGSTAATAATTPAAITEASRLLTDVLPEPLETLVIAPDIGGDDLSQLLSRPSGGEGRPAASTDASQSAATPRTDQTQRSEQYERLSQRLGEALGQRLAAQIAKGDWRVDLALKPHELGNVDIELTMKDGTLQASFSASQALTRELIADSLPRLKEVLSQLGMDVATMNVNVRQNGQHGGNPTPGRSSSGSGSQTGRGDTEKAGEVSASTAARNIGQGPDGLDVLV